VRTNYHHHRTIPGLAIAAFTAASIAGCAMTPVPVEQPEPTPVADIEEELPEQPEGTFGKGAVTYPDGMTVRLSKPEAFTPPAGSYVEGDAPHYVKFTVSVTNDTKDRFDPILTHISVASGQVEGVAVHDVSNGLSNTPSTILPPGDVRSWVVAFGVTDLDDITAQVALNDLVHEPAMFTLRGMS
jgi:hypothetical protein